MTNPFWNRNQKRLRAGWRILVQGLLYFALSNLANLPIQLVAVGMAQTGMSPTQVNNLIMQSPWARLAGILLALGAGLLALWMGGRWLDHRRVAGFGFHFNRGWWLDFAFGLGLGALLLTVIFLIEWAAGWLTITDVLYRLPTTTAPFWVVMALGLAQFIMVGINEEALTRGYELRNLAEGLRLPGVSPRWAVLAAYVITSCMFGLFHLVNPNTSWVSTVDLMAIGLLLGLGYVLTGELAIPIGIHITWNFFEGRVFGFPVSGGAAGSTFIAIRQTGPEIWTGGAFGPEAGLVVLIAIALGCALIALWVRWRRGRVQVETEIAEREGVAEEIRLPRPLPEAVRGA